jgi:hypothetical protein
LIITRILTMTGILIKMSNTRLRSQ